MDLVFLEALLFSSKPYLGLGAGPAMASRNRAAQLRVKENISARYQVVEQLIRCRRRRKMLMIPEEKRLAPGWGFGVDDPPGLSLVEGALRKRS
jgi:hypothetical protein